MSQFLEKNISNLIQSQFPAFPDRVKKRFWSKVRMGGYDDCWEWIASRREFGYGQFWVPQLKRILTSHRACWLLWHGELPSSCILHKCDNPRCVNPHHLFLGSNADNSMDMKSKGRSTRGSKHPGAQLNESQVVEIKKMLLGGETTVRIATLFNVRREVISKIKHGRRWTHVSVS